MLLLSHVALGTAAGEWQAGEENTTHRELWVRGLALPPQALSWGKNKTQRDRSATDNQSSSTLAVCVCHG